MNEFEFITKGELLSEEEIEERLASPLEKRKSRKITKENEEIVAEAIYGEKEKLIKYDDVDRDEREIADMRLEDAVEWTPLKRTDGKLPHEIYPDELYHEYEIFQSYCEKRDDGIKFPLKLIAAKHGVTLDVVKNLFLKYKYKARYQSYVKHSMALPCRDKVESVIDSEESLAAFVGKDRMGKNVFDFAAWLDWKGV